MKKIIIKKPNGFTLIEILVATTIFSTIMIMASMLFGNVIQTNYKLSLQRQVNQEARNVMETISRESRVALGRLSEQPISVTDTNGDGTKELTLTVAPKLKKTFEWSDRNGDGNKDSLVLKNENFNVIETTSIPKLDIMLVIDASGSMITDTNPDPAITVTRIDAVKEAAKSFVDILNKKDDDGNPLYDAKIGLASFHGSENSTCLGDIAGVHTHFHDAFAVTNSNLTLNFNDVKTAIDSITLGSGTGTGRGMKFATDELLSSNHRADAQKFQVLLSDGCANHPYHWRNPPGGDAGYSIQAARDEANNESTRANNDSIKIYTVGFGSGVEYTSDFDQMTTGDCFNTTLLKNIAQLTTGSDSNFFLAENPVQLSSAFEGIAQAITNINYDPTTTQANYLTSDKIDISNLNFTLHDTSTQPFLEIDITVKSKNYDSSPSWRKASATIKTTVSLRNYQ